jgi:hypothetical protein
MKRYLTERLWTAKLRPRAKTRKDAAMEEFRRRMNEQLADAQGASDVPPTNEEKRANCPLCQGMGWVPVEGENRVEACVCRPDQKKTRRRVSAACLAAPGPSEFDGRYRASSSAGEAEQ